MRTDWPAKVGRTGSIYVVPEFKLAYVSTAKNACTSVKWAIAELAREDRSAFERLRLHPYLSQDQAVHSRRLFRNALRPRELDPELAGQVHPDNGWFVFGIARDPRTRLFSAWQDKLLLNEPGFDWAQQEPWYPAQPVGDADAIVGDFARFVRALASDQPLTELRADPHFRPQANTLRLNVIPFSAIYPMHELARLQADLNAHVRDLGWSQPLVLRRTNSTPLRANAAVFADGVRELAEQIYAQDLERFGAMFDFADVLAEPEWSAHAVADAQVRSALGRRLGTVRRVALEHRDRAAEATERADRLAAQVDQQARMIAELRAELDDAEQGRRPQAADHGNSDQVVGQVRKFWYDRDGVGPR